MRRKAWEGQGGFLKYHKAESTSHHLCQGLHHLPTLFCSSDFQLNLISKFGGSWGGVGWGGVAGQHNPIGFILFSTRCLSQSGTW